MKICNTCSYATETGCEVFKDRQVDCTAWADEVEKEKRETAINEYISDVFSKRAEISTTTRDDNTNKRNGLTVKQALDKSFMKWYKKGLNDSEIAEKVHVSETSARLYRVKKGLEQQGKCGRKKACGNRQ